MIVVVYLLLKTINPSNQILSQKVLDNDDSMCPNAYLMCAFTFSKIGMEHARLKVKDFNCCRR